MKTSRNLALIIDSVKHFFTDETRSNEDEEKATVKDLLERLRPIPDTPTRLTVHRSSILTDSISIFKQKFDFTKPLKIPFEGEPAIDGGGPKREFLTILLRELLSLSPCIRLFEGRGNIFLPMHNADALRSNLFKVAGRMVASSVIQGGPGFPNFPRGLYMYFQKQDPNDLIDYIGKEDVVDVDCLDALSKVTFCVYNQNTNTTSVVCSHSLYFAIVRNFSSRY